MLCPASRALSCALALVPARRPGFTAGGAVQIERLPAAALKAGLTHDSVTDVKAACCRQIFRMAASLSGAPMRVATTACIYFHRFFAAHSFLDVDPRTFVAPATYLSGAPGPMSCDAGPALRGWRGAGAGPAPSTRWRMCNAIPGLQSLTSHTAGLCSQDGGVRRAESQGARQTCCYQPSHVAPVPAVARIFPS